jgi:hypothetical protein
MYRYWDMYTLTLIQIAVPDLLTRTRVERFEAWTGKRNAYEQPSVDTTVERIPITLGGGTCTERKIKMILGLYWGNGVKSH